MIDFDKMLSTICSLYKSDIVLKMMDSYYDVNNQDIFKSDDNIKQLTKIKDCIIINRNKNYMIK